MAEIIELKKGAIEKFDEFWRQYDPKQDKKKARTAWDKAIKKEKPDVIIAAAKAYMERIKLPPRPYPKYPATWLNGECWTNEEAKPFDPEAYRVELATKREERARARKWKEDLQAKRPE